MTRVSEVTTRLPLVRPRGLSRSGSRHVSPRARPAAPRARRGGRRLPRGAPPGRGLVRARRRVASVRRRGVRRAVVRALQEAGAGVARRGLEARGAGPEHRARHAGRHRRRRERRARRAPRRARFPEHPHLPRRRFEKRRGVRGPARGGRGGGDAREARGESRDVHTHDTRRGGVRQRQTGGRAGRFRWRKRRAARARVRRRGARLCRRSRRAG